MEKEAEKYVSEEKGVKNVQEAIDGAKDILAENISDEADYRKRIRDLTFKRVRWFLLQKTKKQNLYTRCIMILQKRSAK